MTDIIRDPDFLKSINSDYVSNYINAKGWRKSSTIPDRASIWTLSSEQEEEDSYEILLPLQSTFQDYAIRISEVLRTLSVVEDRSIVEILNEINNFYADIIRIRVEYPEVTDNTISLNNGIRLFDSAKKLMYAISSSVVNPRPFFKGGRFKQVADYMDRLRIGQTEPGSYIIKIISPIANASSNLFEREVIKTLFQALDIANEFPDEIDQEQQLIEFVDRGISANFCEAILNMSQGLGVEGVQFNLNLSNSIDYHSNIPSRININHRILPKLEKAEKKLKSTEVVHYFQNREKEKQQVFSLFLDKEQVLNPLSSTRVVGKVVKLEWGETDTIGRVTIITSSIQREERELEIVIELERSNYIEAFEANLAHRSIDCEGHLLENKKPLTISNVRSFLTL